MDDVDDHRLNEGPLMDTLGYAAQGDLALYAVQESKVALCGQRVY